MGNFNTGDTNNGSDTMLTPPWIIRALGEFDLDPCMGRPRPWNTAREMYCLEDGIDGQRATWDRYKRIWLNPPYSSARDWAKKLSVQSNGVLLVFARTETQMFQRYVFPFATGLFFFEGRLNFYKPNGELATTRNGKVAPAGAPSILISYDNEHSNRSNVNALKNAHEKELLDGYFMELR